jgi:hypothetical protein
VDDVPAGAEFDVAPDGRVAWPQAAQTIAIPAALLARIRSSSSVAKGRSRRSANSRWGEDTKVHKLSGSIERIGNL